MLAVSDNRVESFDIADRDQPLRTSNIALAQYVSKVVGWGDTAVRIGANWYSSETEVDVTSVAELATPRSSAGLDLAVTSGDTCNSYAYLEQAFARGDNAYLVYSEYDYSGSEYQERRRLATLDISDPAAPRVVGESVLKQTPDQSYYDLTLPGAGQSALVAGQALVFNHRVVDWSTNTPRTTESGLYVVSLADPAAPSQHYVELPTGLGITGLTTDGHIVVRSHYAPSPDDRTRVRFYADRVDVSDPEHPVRLGSVNTPGAVIAMRGKRAITADFWHQVTQGVTAETCYRDYARVLSFEVPGDSYDYSTTKGTCTALGQTLHLVEIDAAGATLLGSERLTADEAISQVAVGDGVLFATLANQSGYLYQTGIDCVGCYTLGGSSMRVLSIAGLDSGDFQIGRLDLDAGADGYWGGLIVASGKRALLTSGWHGQLSLVDAESPTKPRLLRQVPVNGYVTDLSIIGHTGVASLGYDGVMTVDLSE